MNTALTVFQIVLSVALTGLIFLQSGDDSDSRSNILSTTTFQKRGLEKAVYFATIGVLVLFLISSIIQTAI
ncbi:MAG: preprotein translocase subunit SecG [Candidatus Shapirobacteria bacterium]|jgi:protein translocase SecG subunit